MGLLRKSLDILVSVWGESRQRVGDTHVGCLRSIRFTAHIDATGIRMWQNVDIRHMSLFFFIGNDGPDFRWFTSLLRRKYGPDRRLTRGGIQHVWIPARYPMLFAKWFKQ